MATPPSGVSELQIAATIARRDAALGSDTAVSEPGVRLIAPAFHHQGMVGAPRRQLLGV